MANDILRMSGMNSGLDTEAIVEAMTAATKLKITKQNRKKRRREYAMNFLDLYEKYRDVPSDENPVAVLFDDILIQAGWYSIAYGLNLFRRYPYLAADIRKAKLRSGSDVWPPLQLFVKLYALLK